MSIALLPSHRVSDPVCRLLRDLLHEKTGIFFEDDRLGTMVERLSSRAQARECGSLLDYYYLLKYDELGDEEWRRVMDAFSVQETYFWREFDQIRVLCESILPDWFRENDRPFRIWSAACATGEEPYSVVIALNESGWANHPIEIHASDASDTALAKARRATYRERSFRAMPDYLRQRYFSHSSDGEVLNPVIADRVSFRWANLMTPAHFADLKEVQAIFCRNVFIYFSPLSIGRVAESFSTLLAPRGHLFIGAAESLLKITDRFDLHEVSSAFVYRRKGVG